MAAGMLAPRMEMGWDGMGRSMPMKAQEERLHCLVRGMPAQPETLLRTPVPHSPFLHLPAQTSLYFTGGFMTSKRFGS